ncbi:MAG: N-acetyl-alpha-D-glucosaminyl L-malate synthase BshA [Ignavibacteriaceae bacterium]|jgi:N-acetyl-alpha-D-glucosaminyl L-malate synthase BshA|nr:N-acetyl-alpha-D-glucosaminyl L-malate synthase BshA [Ignavibacteriaceae bacterium]MCC6638759.1 N-acetyl-alpha-D-glucosaminyl L-malate synthase BshA [Ignavibacteriaceae bacterium]
MKIGITCYPTYGGSGVVATELGIELAKKGHEIHFISYAIPFRLNRFIDNVFYHEVETGTYPLFEFPLYSDALAGKMVEVMMYENLDLIHVHYAIPHATSAYLAKQICKGHQDIKIVTTLHGTDITLVGLEPTYLHLLKFGILQSDGVTAVSRFLKEKTLTNYSIEKDIEVIPNFVDIELYKPDESTAFKCRFAPNGEKLLIHTSNFRPVKRVQDAIKIFDIVRKDVPSKLLLIGDGPDRSECERLSRELGIEKEVIFLGKQEGLAQLLACADLFLLPSQSESFGLAALEAMAVGLPVISTSTGGLPEVISHNHSGFIAEIGDVERMAKYAVDLLTNEKKYNIFSKNARATAVDKFSASRIVPMYEAFYEKVMNS